MSKKKANKNAPFDPVGYQEEGFDYPSDRLTLGQLRLLWPDPETLGPLISRVREMENGFAIRGFGEAHRAASGQLPLDYLKNVAAFEESRKEDWRYLQDFYIHTGLATGDHAAELLIENIERRAKKHTQQQLR